MIVANYNLNRSRKFSVVPSISSTKLRIKISQEAQRWQYAPTCREFLCPRNGIGCEKRQSVLEEFIQRH